MKKFVLIITLLIAVKFNALAQTPAINTPVEKCSFLQPLIFKNGRAIVIIKATYKYMFRSPEEELFHKLEKKKILIYKDYFSNCCGGSEIDFIPENCSKDYHAAMLQKFLFDINKVKQGETLYLTLTAFKNEYRDDKLPFFVISGISLKDPEKL